jgi:hypothetical protein
MFSPSTRIVSDFEFFVFDGDDSSVAAAGDFLDCLPAMLASIKKDWDGPWWWQEGSNYRAEQQKNSIRLDLPVVVLQFVKRKSMRLRVTVPWGNHTVSVDGFLVLCVCVFVVN